MIDRSVSEQLLECGWASGSSDSRDYCDLRDLITRHLGLAQLGTSKILTPKMSASARPGTLSAKFGLGEQSYHTDCANWPIPPRFLMLFGRKVLKPNVETKIIVPDMDKLEQLAGSALGKIWAFKARGFAGFYGKVVHAHKGGSFLRYDPNVMHPTEDAERLEELIVAASTVQSTVLSSNDWLLIDNWRCLHARGAVRNAHAVREIDRTYWGNSSGMGV